MKTADFWKLKSTRIILLVATFLVFLCVVRMLWPNREYLYEGETLFQEGIAISDYPVFEGISLSPGVYRVELVYSCSTDIQNLCWVEDGNVFAGGLLTHGDQLYSGLSKTEFDMWLFEQTDTLQILIKYDGQGYLQTGNLRIYETNGLWGICLTVIVAVTLLLLAILMLRWYDRRYSISQENKNVIFLLSVLVLVVSIPYLAGMMPSGADLTYHLQRIEGIKDGILSGQFPVRLEPEWVHGHGYANGIFYCGTLLLFPALLRIIGFPVTFSYNCYVIALNVLTVWIAYYSFYKICDNKYIGVVGSALYSLSVFRIYKLVITSAVGEGSAVTFMPLVVYGFWRVFTEDVQDKAYRSCWVPLALGYAGLLQTHVLSCEITAFLTLLLCTVTIKKIFRKETLWELCKGAGAAFFLSLWFLVPFFDYYIREDLHIKHVWARPIQERGLYLAQLLFNWWRLGDNALIGESGMRHSHALGVGFILILGFLTFGGLWFFGRFKDSDKQIYKVGKLSLVFSALLMWMSLEVFPWDKIQNSSRLAASLVSSLQFPNRFLGWASTFLVLLFCCCLYYFRERGQKISYFVGLLCALTGIVTSGLYLYDYVIRDHNHVILYNDEEMGRGYISGAEYLVQGTQEETLLYHAPVTGGNILITEYEKGALRADFRCSNVGDQEGYVELPLLHYYGYQAYAGEERVQLPVCKGDNNVIRVLIPAGFDMRVTVRFVSPWYWRVAEIISYMMLLSFLVVYVRHRKEKKKCGDL
ncbi:MAG: hypothetical protein HDR02_15240 [Lachnospiraceae bacterium]|nr:hypothetical protein [Lachnospiraceae bacterium]